MSDTIIIAECGCPTPEYRTCNGCGCCTDCCDGYACDGCGEKCVETIIWHYRGRDLMLCAECANELLEQEDQR